MEVIPGMDMATGMMAGLGLSAACGFRVFVPLLVAGIAARSGQIELNESMQWIQSWPALIAFGTATAAEVGGYYVPWIDNALDSVASPAAVVAGTVTTAAMMPEMSPMFQWTTATILGGGTAGLVQTGTVITRAASTATSAGLGNPVVSTGELGGSLITSVLAVLIPIVAFFLVVVLFFFSIRAIVRFFARRRQGAAIPAAGETAPIDPGTAPPQN